MLTAAARGHELARRHQVPVRRRRGGRVPQRRAKLLALVSCSRARARERRACSSAPASAGCSRRQWRCYLSPVGDGARASSSSARSASSGLLRGTRGIAIAPKIIRPSNADELAWIQQDGAAENPGGTPWRALLTSRNLYAICAMYFAFGYGLYFYFTWLPTYLIKVLGFSLLSGGLLASLPFLFAGVADLAGRSAHRSSGAHARSTRRPLLSGIRRVPHVRIARVCLDAPGAVSGEGGAARAGARVRRPRARRLLGGADRHRARSRGCHHRLHEHAREPRRAGRTPRRRLRGGTAGTRGRLPFTSPQRCTRSARSRGSQSIQRSELGSRNLE